VILLKTSRFKNFGDQERVSEVLNKNSIFDKEPLSDSKLEAIDIKKNQPELWMTKVSRFNNHRKILLWKNLGKIMKKHGKK
jgi:hypothetical protein